ncbi:OmpA family protein [Desulfuromonas versatilis]|nr:OmpA family protein [Desulfuromonas versatilis]
MSWRRIALVALAAAGLGLLGGCGKPPLSVEPVSLAQNPIEQIANLEKDLAVARNNQLHVLAPGWYAKAEESLNDAKRGLEKGDSVTDLLEKAAFGRANLQRAEEAAEVARTALADTIKAREQALAAGATSFGRDYQAVEDDFLELTEAIENDNLSKARKNKGAVTRAFDELELRAIKEQTLGEVRRLLSEAEKNGAKKIAPDTLAVAQQSLSEADAFITEQRYQKEKMQQLASQALFQARRLGGIMSQAELVKTLRPEEVALQNEELLYQITAKLNARDMRDEPFATQRQNILASIVSLQDDQQFLAGKLKEQQVVIEDYQQQLAKAEGRAREVEVARERLAREELFQRLFTEVQGFFAAEEAEVYKQGNNLIIRLKAIQFPVGKEVIMPNNYALLSKVRKAIRNFGEPDVVIEGHTDSTGSAALNAHLSQSRAEAVREYFLANSTLPAERITAVGYGSERPLASNESPEGRAVNRRIDVVIKPSGSAS